jgi:hypothetical protein
VREQRPEIKVIPRRPGRWELFAFWSTGRTIWIADAHRGDGKRFVVHADEKLTAFIELEAAIRGKESRSQRHY